MTRPRLLLISQSSELEWVRRPQIEDWAEVAAFDAPGVGEEAAPEAYDSSAVADLAARKHRGPGRLDRGCLAGSGKATASRRARSLPDVHQGGIPGGCCSLPRFHAGVLQREANREHHLR